MTPQDATLFLATGAAILLCLAAWIYPDLIADAGTVPKGY